LRKLKVGVVGVGMAFERLHYPEFAKMADRFEITALCDVDTAKTASWSQRLSLAQENTFTDWRKMLVARPDIDVVDIMVPISMNFKITKGVAELLGGESKAIICEKPLAANMQDALEARELPQRYRIPVMIAENYRYNDETNILRTLVTDGTIGDTIYFIQNRVMDFPKDMLGNNFSAREWRHDRDFPGGAIADSGVHDIAGLHHIFGLVRKVQAFGRPLEANQDWSPYAVVQANLLFESGVQGNFSFYCTGPEMQRPLVGLRIFGSKGMAYLEDRDCGTVNLAMNDGSSRQIPYQPKVGYQRELDNLYKALTEGERILVTPELEFGDFLVVQMVLQSAAQDGRTVSVADMERLVNGNAGVWDQAPPPSAAGQPWHPGQLLEGALTSQSPPPGAPGLADHIGGSLWTDQH
jgi:predicted dehydrogenase